MSCLAALNADFSVIFAQHASHLWSSILLLTFLDVYRTFPFIVTYA